jgi:hypothetical protein
VWCSFWLTVFFSEVWQPEYEKVECAKYRKLWYKKPEQAAECKKEF